MQKDTGKPFRSRLLIVVFALLLLLPGQAFADTDAEILECTDYIRQKARQRLAKYNVSRKVRVKRTHRKRRTLKGKRNPADRYHAIIMEASRKYKIHPDFIRAVIMVESSFNPRAKSKYAVGLMQLTKATAEDMGVKDRFNPRQSVLGGTKYLRALLLEFKDTTLALKGYNAGPQHIRNGRTDFKPETIEYPGKVFREFRRFQQLSRKGK
ncbi:lytic transglycosylase domain-containing protein [Maridesulfovibrio sp.]|uniref:lytic transglycosylase domain-containing protein n=1 Tax=Maridesulfovibrio sp. TaxID=2795000 RepID=UPI0039EF33AB